MTTGRLIAIALLSMVLSACSQDVVVWRGAATLGDTAMTFTSATTMRAVGRSRAVCVSPIDSMADSHPTQLDVYLVRMDGTKERLGWHPETRRKYRTQSVLTVFPDSMRLASRDTVITSRPAPPSMRERNGKLCAEEWDGPQMLSRYKAIELRSAARLPITEVRWVSQTPLP